MLEKPAVIEEHDVGRQSFRLGDIVSRHQYLGAGSANGADQFLDAPHGGRVEIRGGLVQQQDFGP